MQPEKFAKLFEIKGHQVLFFRDTDDEAETDETCHVIRQITEIKHVRVAIGMSGFSEEAAARAFGDLSESDAESFFASATSLMANLSVAEGSEA